ncbi:hypothetical protein AB4Y96_05590 [Phyllobacterium sp. TAF24]|uniref:hypothetical protein n=1 Tax=Phyllobacterium sp. TAF24 TaxID=3233068 RepID=UPI003F96FA9E
MTPRDPFRTFLWLAPIALFVFACTWLFGYSSFHSRSHYKAMFCAVQHDPELSEMKRKNAGWAHSICHQDW